MSNLSEITAVVVNYKTPDLTRECVEGFLAHYPAVPLILVDNGSADASTAYIKEVAGRHGHVTALLNATNRYHGPALDQAIRLSVTPYVLTLDSDCVVTRGGLLEGLREACADPAVYAAGELRYMDFFGFDLRPGAPFYTRYIHPYAMLLDRHKYLGLRPFAHHGSPCLRNMRAAQRRGYSFSDFPVAAYVRHRWRGTCSRYGYGLGVMTLVQKQISKWLWQKG